MSSLLKPGTRSLSTFRPKSLFPCTPLSFPPTHFLSLSPSLSFSHWCTLFPYLPQTQIQAERARTCAHSRDANNLTFHLPPRSSCSFSRTMQVPARAARPPPPRNPPGSARPCAPCTLAPQKRDRYQNLHSGAEPIRSHLICDGQPSPHTHLSSPVTFPPLWWILETFQWLLGTDGAVGLRRGSTEKSVWMVKLCKSFQSNATRHLVRVLFSLVLPVSEKSRAGVFRWCIH